ncbi:MAG TPA: signal peptide peptidase SppA [Candidatus Aveggerthella excrementigallinarum]|nr:signal peptide peptidase SppA [Candidatus Aveggerthella excrementigallinarum]
MKGIYRRKGGAVRQDNWQQNAWQQPQQSQQPQQQPQPQSPQQQPQQPPQQVQPTQHAGYSSVAYAVPQQQPRRGWIVALVAVILLFIALMFGMFSCSNAFSGVTSLGTSLEGSSPVATTGPTVAVINLSGTIQYDGSACSPEGLKALLDEAEADADIKAVVLRVDSGGGTATAGEEMATYVRDFSKPVVVSSASMNASAAYEISSQADWIFTAKSTAIGSIGTAMQVTDLSGLYEKLGIDIENITSAEGKDSSYGTRALTDEERASYQRMVDQINETFLETVAEGRGMDVEEVRALATGMTFTGIDAVENGLADELGTLEDACAKAAALGDAGDAYDVVTLEDESSALDDLLSWENSSEESDVLEALKELDTDGSIVK